MKLVLDNIIFFLQRAGGGSVYWNETVSRLNSMDYEVLYTEPRGKFVNIFYETLRPRLRHAFMKESWGAMILSFLPFRSGNTSKFVFHSSYYRVASSPRAINIVTIHDFMPEMFFHGFKRSYHAFRKKKAIQRADGIVCVSENTRRDLLKYYPNVAGKLISTIHLGISTDYCLLNQGQDSLSDGEMRNVLFVGKRSGYKNFQFAVDVVANLKNHNLVIVGAPLEDADLRSLSSLNGRFTVVENPGNGELNRLYNGARCLLYPSSYEGFGIPVLEAMAAGCPVVAFNKSSIPEIANGAALLVDTLSVKDFTTAIVSLENKSLRDDLRAKGLNNAKLFSWERSVSRLCEFYNLVSSKFER